MPRKPKDVDTFVLGDGKQKFTFKNCVMDTWIKRPDGTVVETHERLDPKTLTWKKRVRAKK